VDDVVSDADSTVDASAGTPVVSVLVDGHARTGADFAIGVRSGLVVVIVIVRIVVVIRVVVIRVVVVSVV
jgi:hypothetical protein